MDNLLKKNFAYLFLLQNLNYLVPLLLIPYLTRVLGPDSFGRIAFVQALVNYFVLITDFGFNTSTTQHIVISKSDRLELSRVFWTTFFVKGFLALLSFIVLLCAIGVFGRLRILAFPLLLAYGSVIGSWLFPIWLFQGLEKMELITWFTAIPRLLMLLGMFIFVKDSSDDTIAIFLQSLSMILSGIICLLYIHKKRLVCFYIPKWNEGLIAVRDSWPIFASSLSTTVYTTTNVVVLGLFSTETIVGCYAAADKIIRAIISIGSSVTQVTFPRINHYAVECHTKAISFGKKYLILIISVMGITGIILAIFAPVLVVLLFGALRYEQSISLLRLSSLLPLLSVVNGFVAINFLVTFGFRSAMLRIVMLGGLFSLLSIVPATIYLGASGVVFVATATELLIGLLLIYTLYKYKIWNRNFEECPPYS